jgi:hypothetical protein
MNELLNMKHTVTQKYILYICTCLALSLGDVSADTVVFTKPDSADWTLPENQDRITNNVWITRKDIQSLFNIAQEDGYSGSNGSPVGTLWSDTITAAADSASYTNFVAMNGGGPQSLIGDTVSMYLPQDGLYFDVTFLSYSGGNTGGGFSYSRTSVTLSVDEPKTPTVFTVSENFPNPFNPTTTFEYDLPKASDVTLRIYDITGREVNQIQFFQKPAGKHRFVINGSDLGSGMYFLHFSSGFFQSIKKMILLK